MLLWLLLQSAQPATDPNAAVRAAIEQWTRCVDGKAREWALLPNEPADIVARGAVADCQEAEATARSVLIVALRAEGLAGGKAEAEAPTMIDRRRAILVEGAIATVLEVRTARIRRSARP